MKKVLFLLIAGLMAAVTVQAVPAHPKPVKVQQPDGTYVTIRLHGDEWLNFTTTEDGYSVVKDQRGYFVYAELKDKLLKPTAQVAHDAKQRSVAEKSFLNGVKKFQVPAMTAEKAAEKDQVQQQQRRALASRRATSYNNFRGLVILVQFNDKEFSRPDYKTVLTDMLNKENYTGYDSEEYTGSVRDYFSDNSGGKFKPTFDVVGPVTLNYSQYDPQQTNNARAIVNAAVDAVDSEVDFSQYDGDGDGYVDLVFFMFAGNGANYIGNDSRLWWPHRSQIIYEKDGSYYYKILDNIKLWDYASSVELYGSTEYSRIDGIGTICHEFSHVLGLPDFYDTNYGNDGMDESIHPGDWSVMAGGSYSNYSRTPVGYSLYERYAVGFTDEPTKISAAQSYTLEPLHVNQKGYRVDSPVDNEFFLFENRRNDGSFKWDVYLPGHGMLAYRVDQTDTDVWSSNTVNANPNHNYYEILWAGGAGQAVSGYDTFPGEGNVTELDGSTAPANLQTHNGSATPLSLINIREVSNNILFDVTSPTVLRPGDLTVSYTGGTTAEVTWTSTESVFDIDVNGVVTENVTNPYTLSNLEYATNYTVKVRAKNGSNVSYWSTPASFKTFLSDSMCQISFELTDSYGDGWNGAAIQVVDVLSGIEIGRVSNTSDAGKDEAQTFQMAVPDDRDIRFVWISGSYDTECSYAVYDINGTKIFSGNGAMTAPVTHHVSCISIPTDVAANDVTATTATITWTSSNDNFNVRYREVKSISYDFESAEAWAVDDFAPFTTYDGDGRPTYGIQNTSFTNQQYTGSVIAFQNGTAGNFTAYSGNAFGCFMDAVPSGDIKGNNDWFITPEIEVKEGMVFSFWARSVTNSYGLERFKVGVYGSTDGTFASYLEGGPGFSAEAPLTWTQYSYDLSAYVGQTIRLAINCVSEDAFAFCIDDVFLGVPGNDTWEETVMGVTLPYLLTGLTPETIYEVQVQAVTTEGTSGWSTSAFFTTLEQTIIPGDANGDGKVTFADVIAIVNYLLGKPSGNFVPQAANMNGDTDESNNPKITISDALTLLYYLNATH